VVEAQLRLDPYVRRGDADLVRDEPRPCRVRSALIIARGYGGFNAALVLRAPNSTATGGDR
ncbi:hypothetical protein AB0K48_50185, partial [Nonomuraea sp. NPDC055795]